MVLGQPLAQISGLPNLWWRNLKFPKCKKLCVAVSLLTIYCFPPVDYAAQGAAGIVGQADCGC